MELLIKIVVVIAVLGILFVIKSRADKKSYKKRMLFLIESEWGCDTREEYTDKVFQNIRFLHEQKKSSRDIDDITWNDLEMDEIFMRMNHTRTSAGEEYLYHLLRSPEYHNAELTKREDIISQLQQNSDRRSELEFALYDIGKTDQISVYEFLCKAKELRPMKRWPHVISILLLLVCIALLPVSPSAMLLAMFGVMGINAYFYYKEKGKVLSYLALFSFILGTIRQCNAICGIPIPGCEKEQDRMRELSGRFQKFARFSFLVSGGDSLSGSLFDSLFDYVRILFHVDLIKLGTMIQEVRRYEEELLELYDIIGYLDAMIAVASYRDMMGEYCVPCLEEHQGEKKYLKINELYHPLINHPVKNSIDTQKSMLFTGSNASGKSTFLKAVAINVILSQTIHTVLADSYDACFYRVYSSMALRDDILSKESYFIVEIKSLKRIFAGIAKDSVPVLCFIDEILRGTNTVERVAASSQLLEELAKENALCFAATHDIELTYLLEELYTNCHFEELLSEGDVSFDYRLKDGRANSRNAIRLLEMIGFDQQVVDQSQKRVETFLEKGIWE